MTLTNFYKDYFIILQQNYLYKIIIFLYIISVNYNPIYYILQQKKQLRNTNKKKANTQTLIVRLNLIAITLPLIVSLK